MQASASTPTAAADQAKSENGAIRPFRVDMPEEALDDLRRRIAATRWTGKEPPRTIKAGEALMVRAEAVYAVKNVGGGDGAKLATFVVEKGTPLITLVEQANSERRSS